jgi:hypothetical protein
MFNRQGHEVNGFTAIQFHTPDPNVAETERIFITMPFPKPPRAGSSTLQALWNELSGGPDWAPFWDTLLTDTTHSGELYDKHVSFSLNIDRSVGGVVVDIKPNGAGSASAGMGFNSLGKGVVSLTMNVNFGTQPPGYYAEFGGAYGTGWVGRFSIGWGLGTGVYGSVGFGVGWARSFGATPAGYTMFNWGGE